MAIHASGGPLRQRLIVVTQVRNCRTLPSEDRATHIGRRAAQVGMREMRIA
jgi:hypothetical protein